MRRYRPSMQDSFEPRYRAAGETYRGVGDVGDDANARPARRNRIALTRSRRIARISGAVNRCRGDVSGDGQSPKELHEEGPT